MLIVGERINTSRKRIEQAVRERDAKFIRTEARRQAEAGAHFIDVNAGTSVSRETDDLCWLVQTVQDAVEVPLCIDTCNPNALEPALKLHKRCRPLINSISGEKERLAQMLPLVKEHGALVVALAMDDGGMPSAVDDRLAIIENICKAVSAAGLPLERVYVDPLVRPISTNQDQALVILEVVRRLRQQGKVHTICGLSNVSFGLPNRAVLNRVFLAMMIAAGIDAVIIDPTDPAMMATLFAGAALANDDQFCMNYINAARQGRLDKA